MHNPRRKKSINHNQGPFFSLMRNSAHLCGRGLNEWPVCYNGSLVYFFQKSKYHRSHTLNYKNGYALPIKPTVAVGGEPIPTNQLNEQELDELANFNPTLTYGQAKQAPPEDFVPAHVAWDKKVGTVNDISNAEQKFILMNNEMDNIRTSTGYKIIQKTPLEAFCIVVSLYKHFHVDYSWDWKKQLSGLYGTLLKLTQFYCLSSLSFG